MQQKFANQQSCIASAGQPRIMYMHVHGYMWQQAYMHRLYAMIVLILAIARVLYISTLFEVTQCHDCKKKIIIVG